MRVAEIWRLQAQENSDWVPLVGDRQKFATMAQMKKDFQRVLADDSGDAAFFAPKTIEKNAETAFKS